MNLSDEPPSVQFWYIHSQLEGLALNQVTLWVAACVKPNEAVTRTIIEELIGQLRHAYDDPESRERATRNLGALKQKGKPFARHLATFERTLLEAGGLEWDNAVKKTFLGNSLDSTLIRALVATPIPPLYDEYVALLQRVSHNLKAIAKTATQERRMATTTTTQQSHTDSMDWEPTGHAVVAAAGTEEKHWARWVPEKELAERRTKGLCIRCGGDRHFVGKCKLLPAKRPQVTNVAVAGLKEEFSDEEENSGKE